MRELQTTLTRLGFDTQGADGIVGPRTRSAIRAFQESYQQAPSGYLTAEQLALLLDGELPSPPADSVSYAPVRKPPAQPAQDQQDISKAWQAGFSIDTGTLTFVLPDEQQDTDFAALLKALREHKLKTLLASAGAALETRISVSDLSWINLLFSNPFQLAVSGSGEVAAKVNIDSGWLAEGTALQVQPHDLRINILDYVATGDGGVTLRVEQSGEYPDMTLDAGISNASLKRRGEEKAVVERVELNLAATAHKVSLAKDRNKRRGSGSQGAEFTHSVG